MTDRHAGYLVTLENDIREDDAQPTLEAIRQIKGVIGVTPILADFHQQLGKIKAECEIKQKILALFWGTK